MAREQFTLPVFRKPPEQVSIFDLLAEADSAPADGPSTLFKTESEEETPTCR